MSDALAELVAHLERDGDVPLAWAVAHAPERGLSALWSACRDGPILLRLHARLRAMRPLGLALLARGRAFVRDTPGATRARTVVALLETWCAGGAVTQAMLSPALVGEPCPPDAPTAPPTVLPPRSAAPPQLVARALRAARSAYRAALRTPDREGAARGTPRGSFAARAAARAAYWTEMIAEAAGRDALASEAARRAAAMARVHSRAASAEAAAARAAAAAQERWRVAHHVPCELDGALALIALELGTLHQQVALPHVESAMRCLWESEGSADGPFEPWLARAIRAALPCPTLDQLRAAYRRS